MRFASQHFTVAKKKFTTPVHCEHLCVDEQLNNEKKKQIYGILTDLPSPTQAII